MLEYRNDPNLTHQSKLNSYHRNLIQFSFLIKHRKQSKLAVEDKKHGTNLNLQSSCLTFFTSSLSSLSILAKIYTDLKVVSLGKGAISNHSSCLISGMPVPG